MNKVYLLNQPLNASTFTIYTEGGNGVCYQFRGGNVNTNTPASFMTDNEYYQSVLENSPQFKSGAVVFDKSTATAIAKAQTEKLNLHTAKDSEDTPAKKEQVEGITTVSEAINYVAERWGETAKTAKQAKDIALSHGVDFVELRVGKSK